MKNTTENAITRPQGFFELNTCGTETMGAALK
jgi:hypothetical protein